MSDEGLELLARAILSVSISDFKHTLGGKVRRIKTEQGLMTVNQEEVQRFFASDWFLDLAELAHINPQAVLYKMRKYGKHYNATRGPLLGS